MSPAPHIAEVAIAAAACSYRVCRCSAFVSRAHSKIGAPLLAAGANRGLYTLRSGGSVLFDQHDVRRPVAVTAAFYSTGGTSSRFPAGRSRSAQRALAALILVLPAVPLFVLFARATALTKRHIRHEVAQRQLARNYKHDVTSLQAAPEPISTPKAPSEDSSPDPMADPTADTRQRLWQAINEVIYADALKRGSVRALIFTPPEPDSAASSFCNLDLVGSCRIMASPYKSEMSNSPTQERIPPSTCSDNPEPDASRPTHRNIIATVTGSLKRWADNIVCEVSHEIGAMTPRSNSVERLVFSIPEVTAKAALTFSRPTRTALIVVVSSFSGSVVEISGELRPLTVPLNKQQIRDKSTEEGELYLELVPTHIRFLPSPTAAAEAGGKLQLHRIGHTMTWKLGPGY